MEPPKTAPELGELAGSAAVPVGANRGARPTLSSLPLLLAGRRRPLFPYGDGIRLQLRSAVSHVNEVWAVETGGAILHAFADDLGWEFIYDAARWTYDESRHMRMGYERLKTWGYPPEEIPLGSYIYDSARGQDPVIRLGMLHYFETKNIGKKTKRAEAFAAYAGQGKPARYGL